MPNLLAHLCRAVCLAIVTTAAPADTVTVFAAASLRGALDDIAEGFSTLTEHDVQISYAGSSALARQIELGAPADVFVSANSAWMDHLEAAGLVASETRFNFASNRLVLIWQGTTAVPVVLSKGFDFAPYLHNGRLAMALVDAVPVGIYGKAALVDLGLWDSVADRVAQTDNARAALALVALGHARLGVVYISDALAEPGVSILATFPTDSHPPIVYPASAINGRDRAAVLAFLDTLQSETSADRLTAYGFLPLR